MQAAHSIVQYQQVQDPVSDNMLGLALLLRSTKKIKSRTVEVVEEVFFDVLPTTKINFSK